MVLRHQYLEMGSYRLHHFMHLCNPFHENMEIILTSLCIRDFIRKVFNHQTLPAFTRRCDDTKRLRDGSCSRKIRPRFFNRLVLVLVIPFNMKVSFYTPRNCSHRTSYVSTQCRRLFTALYFSLFSHTSI